MQKQESKKISRIFSFFILFVFCITGIYQSYVLADSLFVCPNTVDSVIYERSLFNLSQDVYQEDCSPLEQLTFICRDHQRCVSVISDLSAHSDTCRDFSQKNYVSSFTNILQENCLNHFSSTIITDYVHLTDGEKKLESYL